MSIATLKRKTQAKYNNMSVNSKNGFSLNGTTRSQGYVGQTSVSRSLPRTLMRGNTIRGHGGCCGTYKEYPVVQSGIISMNDNTVVKPSVISISGLNAAAPCNIVDKMKYIPYIPTSRSPCIDILCDMNNQIETNCTSCINKSVGGLNINKREMHTKPKEFYTTMTSSDYLVRLHKGLTQELKAAYIPTQKTLCGVPLPN